MGRIFWILVGSEETPSSRIHGLRVHEFLLRRGWDSRILHMPPFWIWDPPLYASDLRRLRVFQPGDAVVFQKVRGPNTLSVLNELQSAGVATIYIDCDVPVKLDVGGCATLIICSSSDLADRYRQAGVTNLRWIPDAFEWTAPPKPPARTRPLLCAWFGNVTPEKWTEVEDLRTLIAATLKDWKLIRISDHPESEVRWNNRDAGICIARSDVVVLPGSDAPWARAKSANKAIQAMALGLPVVAHPIPAYSEVIFPGRNGFLCRDPHEWVMALRELENPELRGQLSRSGYRFARRYFSMDRVGQLWESAFTSLGIAPANVAASARPAPSNLNALQELLRSRTCDLLRYAVTFG